MSEEILLPLDSDPALATLARVGGKGANLARLARAGFPVPPGFLVTTDAYRAFVAANRLDRTIAAALDGLDAGDPNALDTASAAIRAGFAQGDVPAALEQPLRAAYAALGAPPVAVRSSATAEDLPDLSFAGQQDTYLNVQGDDALLHAVVACWGSLWTARAIGYRARNAIEHSQVALAVVVQAMVQSEASGVLFTANPLTGLRRETVIDATLGLGEALVAGQVEPDQYVVETATGRIVRRTLGAKALSIRSVHGGGVERVDEQAAEQQALPDAVIQELTALGRRVAQEYGNEPQDIEFAWAGGRLFLLQARPITSLYPLPQGIPPGELAVMFSFGAVQGMLDPMTPLGIEVFRHMSTGFARLWGFEMRPGAVTGLREAGQRLWVRFDALLRNEMSRRLIRFLLSMVEPGAARALESVLDEPQLAPLRSAPQPATMKRIARFLGPLLTQLAATLRDPERERTAALRSLEETQAEIHMRTAQTATLPERIALAETLFQNGSRLVIEVLPRLAAGMMSLYRFLALVEAAGIPRSEALEATRGLPHNVTTEMNLALWEVARTIQADPGARAVLEAEPAATLAGHYAAGTLPAAAQQPLAGFLARYGARGAAEIDFGRARWREEPTQVLQMVQNYLRIADPEQAPDVQFARGRASAEQAIERMVEQIRARKGPAQARMAAFFAGRLRALAGLRETPKFFMIQLLGAARAMLLDSFRDLAARGVLADPQDGFFLTLDELRAVAAGYAIDWQALVRERKAIWARERRRGQVPRLLLSDGRAFYGGAAAADGVVEGDGVLVGSPVSPGVAEGRVRVVLEPHNAHLQPGEILVCPGTDPAWTPLFLSAAGLVMEVGGLMTHGSVVAREYGIPAVVGVTQATQRLHTGQRIRVDGSAGRITLLNEQP